MVVSQILNLSGCSANQKGTERLKQEVHYKAKKKTETITDDQREFILAQGREEGRSAFLKQLANYFLLS